MNIPTTIFPVCAIRPCQWRTSCLLEIISLGLFTFLRKIKPASIILQSAAIWYVTRATISEARQ